MLPTGQIYVRGIFVENSHDIFPKYSQKGPYKIPWNYPKQCSGKIEYRNTPCMFHEYPRNVTCIL